MGMMWILFALILLIDLPVLLKSKTPKNIFLFLLLLIPAVLLTILTLFGMSVPSLILMLGDMLKSMGIYYKS